MTFREAKIEDIKQIQIVRNSVKENMLSNPALVSDLDCENFIFNRGKGWVCEIDNLIVGFAIADLKDENIWELFLLPEFEGKGFGKKLQQIMPDWYFSTGKEYVWLGTSPNTRAEKFYINSGWKKNGMHGKNEVKFEMSKQDWIKIKHSSHRYPLPIPIIFKNQLNISSFLQLCFLVPSKNEIDIKQTKTHSSQKTIRVGF